MKSQSRKRGRRQENQARASPHLFPGRSPGARRPAQPPGATCVSSEVLLVLEVGTGFQRLTVKK